MPFSSLVLVFYEQNCNDIKRGENNQENGVGVVKAIYLIKGKRDKGIHGGLVCPQLF